MKKILYSFSILFSQLLFSQNVGINTNSPKQTLDIHGSDKPDAGTLAIKDVSLPTNDPEESGLGWIPSEIKEATNANKANNGEIVKYNYSTQAQTSLAWMNFGVIINTPAEDKANNIPFPSGELNLRDAYHLMLTGAQLQGGQGKVYVSLVNVPDNKNISGARAGNRAFPVVGATNRLGGGSARRGHLRTVINYSGIKDNITLSNESGNLAMAIPIVFLRKNSDGKHYFYADYPDTYPIAFNYQNSNDDELSSNGLSDRDTGAISNETKFTWNSNLIFIREQYIRSKKDVEIDLKTGNNYVDDILQ